MPDSGLLCDLLWSDPEADISGWAENDRGVSYTFGADVVAKFLQKHDYARAHYEHGPAPPPPPPPKPPPDCPRAPSSARTSAAASSRTATSSSPTGSSSPSQRAQLLRRV